MKEKYHITVDGTVARCKAFLIKCPLGGFENHFPTAREAFFCFQQRMIKEYGWKNKRQDDALNTI